MASSRAAASSSCGRSSAAVPGAGTASTTPSASCAPLAGRDRPAVALAVQARRALLEADVHAAATQRVGQRGRRARPMPPSSAQKSGGPSGSGAGISARSARMRLPRRPAAARSGGNTAAADMSSTDPAWMPPMRGSTSASVTRGPSLRVTSGPMERSPSGPRTSGRGQERVAQQPEPAPQAQDAAPRGRPDAGGHAEGQALGQGAQPATGEDRGAPAGDRHQGVAESHLAGELDCLGASTEEAVGSHVHRPPAERGAAQRTAEAVRGLEEDDGRRLARRLGAAGELPGRAEAADATPDHHHALRGHVRRPGPPPSRRRPGRR